MKNITFLVQLRNKGSNDAWVDISGTEVSSLKAVESIIRGYDYFTDKFYEYRLIQRMLIPNDQVLKYPVRG